MTIYRPGGSVDTLQHGVAGVASPISTGHPGQVKGLAELAGRRQMRSKAKVDEFALPIERQRFVLRDILDYLCFVLLADASKEFHRFVALPFLALNGFVPIDDFLHALFDDEQILRRKRFFACEVVIEAVLDRRANRHLRVRPQLFDGFGQDMGGIVTQ